MNYAEAIGDHESGWMNGIQFTRQSSIFIKGIGQWNQTILFSYISEYLRYVGFYILSNQPSTFWNLNNILKLEFQTGIEQYLGTWGLIQENLILGDRYWDRGGMEEYNNAYVGMGTVFKPFKKFFPIGFRISGRWSPSARVLNIIIGDGLTLTRGNAYNYRVSIPISIWHSPSFSFDVTGFYSHWYFNQSEVGLGLLNGKDYLLYEPSSETNEVGANLKASFSWQ